MEYERDASPQLTDEDLRRATAQALAHAAEAEDRAQHAEATCARLAAEVGTMRQWMNGVLGLLRTIDGELKATRKHSDALDGAFRMAAGCGPGTGPMPVVPPEPAERHLRMVHGDGGKLTAIVAAAAGLMLRPLHHKVIAAVVTTTAAGTLTVGVAGKMIPLPMVSPAVGPAPHSRRVPYAGARAVLVPLAAYPGPHRSPATGAPVPDAAGQSPIAAQDSAALGAVSPSAIPPMPAVPDAGTSDPASGNDPGNLASADVPPVPPVPDVSTSLGAGHSHGLHRLGRPGIGVGAGTGDGGTSVTAGPGRHRRKPLPSVSASPLPSTAADTAQNVVGSLTGSPGA